VGLIFEGSFGASPQIISWRKHTIYWPQAFLNFRFQFFFAVQDLPSDPEQCEYDSVNFQAPNKSFSEREVEEGNHKYIYCFHGSYMYDDFNTGGGR